MCIAPPSMCSNPSPKYCDLEVWALYNVGAPRVDLAQSVINRFWRALRVVVTVFWQVVMFGMIAGFIAHPQSTSPCILDTCMPCPSLRVGSDVSLQIPPRTGECYDAADVCVLDGGRTIYSHRSSRYQYWSFEGVSDVFFSSAVF